MSFTKADYIANVTKSSRVKEYCYNSSVFKQTVVNNNEGDFEVNEKDIDVKLKLDIPVHTYDSFIITLTDLRKNFDVSCAYSKEPISFENHPSDNDNIVRDKNYSFDYWNSVHNNVLYSDLKSYNVFIYLNEFERYVSLNVTAKKNDGGVTRNAN